MAELKKPVYKPLDCDDMERSIQLILAKIMDSTSL